MFYIVQYLQSKKDKKKTRQIDIESPDFELDHHNVSHSCEMASKFHLNSEKRHAPEDVNHFSRFAPEVARKATLRLTDVK